MKVEKRIISSLCAAALMIGSFAPASMAESAAKWAEEKTKDGWIKITQEGGKTLGYSPDSGVSILTVDGYAFKDLDRDGELDAYEDWRLDADARSADLAERLDYKLISALMTHGDINGMEIDASNATLAMAAPGSGVEYDPADADMVNSVLPRGLRTFISRLSSMPALQQAKLHNNLQKRAEELEYGIPILFTTDPLQHLTRN